MSPDLERIIDLEPDVVLLSPFENSGGYGRVEELGVPIVECADYMETSALGRAEWMKFYGRLFGVGDEADKLFDEVNSDYQKMKAKAADAAEKPSVIMDMKLGSVWYVPGGQSTQGRLWADANATYPYANDEHSGSLSLSFEAVFDKAGESDIWVIRYNQPTPLTYRQLASDYHGNAEMKAYKQRNVYGCNTAYMPFYEETPFHPDRLLGDFIQICHPEIDLGGLHYYEKLSE
jgi:iron complex transport system substrate-binding protein